MKKRKIVLSLAVAAGVMVMVAMAFWNNGKRESYDVTETAMSTVISYHLFGINNKEAKVKMAERLDWLENEKLSWRKEKAEVANINEQSGNKIEISSEMYKWLKKVQAVSTDSKGALDVTVSPLARLWNIEGENPAVPETNDIKECLKLVGYERLDFFSDRQIQMEKGTSLDLGAVGKGIACDELTKIMRECNVAGTVSVGGSIAVVGEKPDESAWKLGIQDPRANTGEVMGVLIMNEGFLSTSGDYEKYFVENGVRYHHILDAHTGKPADRGLTSVTIVARDGLTSDALSTACFVLGVDEGIKLAEKYKAEAIFIDNDRNVYVTNGIRGNFRIVKDEYHLEDFK